MNLKTFYRIYYRHRFEKANVLLKVYLYITIFPKYLINLFYLPSKKNLDIFSKKNFDYFQKDLNNLFQIFNSDKGEKFINQYTQPSKKNNITLTAHGYAKFYEKYFKEIRDKKLNIIELGSFYGNASAALFFYFKNSIIYSADINPDMYLYKSKRLKNFFIDSSSRFSIEQNLIKKNLNFDIIIEDASHMLKDQIISLFMLFKILKPGGIFIIEEIDFPEKKEDMRINQTPPDLKTILNKILQKEDFKSDYIKKDEKSYFLNNYDTIEFFKGNINEIAIIRKKFF